MASLSPTKPEPFSVGATVRGHSGRTYKIQQILAERRDPLLCVYQASAEGKNYIIKNMIPGEFEHQQDLQKPLASCPNLRTVMDTIPDLELFVYHFLAGDLLRISQRPMSEETRRSILRSALTGLAELHDRGIIHTDIKPNNILVDYKEMPSDNLAIQSVQVSDLEDAVLLPPGKNLKGCLCGNQLWRSPESWARARQNTPSDIFSFGVVAIYVMLDDMVLRASDEELGGDDAWRYVLRRHISYFADEDGFKGLLQHIGEENPFFERLITLAGDFDAQRPRKPFAMWDYVDAELRDLIVKMTNLDPARRISAREALEHPWFRQANLEGDSAGPQ
ncbi:kinase-like protein [Phialemonium atrogriseum]|uniref:Kinase-like protein n=1 Tax=Phialemonium atrogriseum TaxID=1093897 RepID=A0AAJ0BPQ0_9PEZI|nr:kinase-like protein [Phialemonium atrogriseum]KAK1762031.1 kinase-like protein [Phialemonium atrogriseum]